MERVNTFPVAYLPLGTLEWHGLHMPLGADGIQSKGIFEQMAHNIGGVVLPMLFVGPDKAVHKNGTSYYGMDYYSFEPDFPQQLEGSAYYMEDSQFDALLDTVMSNLHRAGFQVVIAHGHGPSTEAFTKRKQLFLDKYNLITQDLWELGYKGDDGIQTDHAAANETSLVMALRPDLVDIKKLSPDGIPVALWGKDPRKAASAKKGKELIQNNIALASEKIQAIVVQLSIEKRKLDYHNIKSLL